MPTKKSSSSRSATRKPASSRSVTPSAAASRHSARKTPAPKKRAARGKSAGSPSRRPASPGRSSSSGRTPSPRRPASFVGRVYADPTFVPLTGAVPTGEANQYDAYASILQPIPPPRAGASLVVNLADVLGQNAVDAITAAGKIVFHSVGDTGADKQNRVVDEADVAGAMSKDLATDVPGERPSFFYHLGDVVYEFGQPDCYYAQFYEPFCRYNAPIFAIPGNHDGMIWDPSMKSLDAFLNNFCTPSPVHADNAGSLMRTTMDQPGVYFTLEAPFVTIIGLYSNVVDKGPGVISTEGNPKYASAGITDAQKNWFISELKRIAPIRQKNNTAVIVALHHPPFSGNSATANTLGADLDDAFTKGGLWPDLVLSGHSHLYERYERTVNGVRLPYVVAGCGGYNLSPYAVASDPNVKVPPSMAKDPSVQAYMKTFGYMKIKATADQLAVVFSSIDPSYGAAVDSIVIDLKTHVVTEGKKGREPL